MWGALASAKVHSLMVLESEPWQQTQHEWLMPSVFVCVLVASAVVEGPLLLLLKSPFDGCCLRRLSHRKMAGTMTTWMTCMQTWRTGWMQWKQLLLLLLLCM
jgi:hypothetical protein